jgi:hypothetical protein
VAAAAPSVVLPGQPATGAKSRKPSPPGGVVRKTLDGMKAYPIWYRRIPPPIFLAIVAVLVISLIAVVFSIRSKQVAPRPVDVKAEVKHAKERQLRREGNALVAQGRVDDAYAKFAELARVAPNSPANNEMLRKLSVIRQQNQANQAQLGQAKEKFNEGLSLYNQQKYSDAIKAFEESFHLNPNSDETANYLKFAQQAEDLARREKQQKQFARQQEVVTQTTGQRPVTPMTGTHPPTTTGAGPATAAMARLTTVVNADVTDGYILVKAGSQVLAYEQLWQEQGRLIFKKRVAKPVNVTKELTPANTDLEVYFVVPNLNVSDHKTFRQNFQPGVAHTLTVTFDPASKRVDYHVN